MTRELKLALIVGFALVLVVTVLISDHLSHARQTRIAAIPADNLKVVDPQPIALEQTPEPIAAGSSLGGQPNVIAPMPLTGSGATSEPGPLVLSQGNSSYPVGTPTKAPTLEETVRAGGGRIEGGTIHLGPAMQVASEPYNPNTAGPGGNPLAPALVPPAPKTGAIGAVTAPFKPTIGSMPLPAPVAHDPVHLVADGDNFFRISKQYYGDGKLWRKLVKYNNLAESAPVKVGQKIKVPSKDVLLGKSVLAGSTPTLPTALTNAPSSKPSDRVVPLKNGIPLTGASSGKTAVTTSLTGPKARTYTVKKGDTLADIARRELGSVKRGSEIIALNKSTIKDSDNVPLGAVLTLPN